MKVDKICFYSTDGSCHYLDTKKDIEAVMLSLPRKLIWKTNTPTEKLQKVYFVLLDELNKNCKTGYSKIDLHEALKPMIMNKLLDMPQYFEDGIPVNNTTSSLNYEGWRAIIEQLKVVANDIFQYTFK